jgi:hypothetical protein
MRDGVGNDETPARREWARASTAAAGESGRVVLEVGRRE